MSKGKKTTLEDMSREAERRQDNLAADIDELVDRINPRNAVLRWKNEALDAAKGFSGAGDDKDARGRLAVVAGGVIGVVALVAGVAIFAATRGGADADPAPTASGRSSAKRSAAKPAKVTVKPAKVKVEKPAKAAKPAKASATA